MHNLLNGSDLLTMFTSLPTKLAAVTRMVGGLFLCDVQRRVKFLI